MCEKHGYAFMQSCYKYEGILCCKCCHESNCTTRSSAFEKICIVCGETIKVGSRGVTTSKGFYCVICALALKLKD